MKRYSRSEIKRAFETGVKLEVKGFAQTKFIEVNNSEYNQNIIDADKSYKNLSCIIYDENMKTLNIDTPIQNFIQVYGK